MTGGPPSTGEGDTSDLASRGANGPVNDLANRWPLALYGLALVAAAGLAYIAATRSHFYNDDMLSLFQLRTGGLSAFLWEPLNVQRVPLHRAVTAGLDGLCRYQYACHVAVLLAVHLAGLFYLRRVLVRLLGDNLVAATLTFVYASYPLLGVQFIWFSSGLHRLPYLLATFIAFDCWLSYREDGGRKHLAAITLAALLATGFYTKGVLIPVHVAAFELCLWIRTGARDRMRHALALVPLVVLAGIGGLLLKAQAQAELVGARTGWVGQMGIQWHAWHTFLDAFVGRVQGDMLGPPRALREALATTGLWLCLVAFTIARHRRALLVWLVVLTTTAANVAIISLSDRGAVWGPFLASSYRYYVDQLGVVLPMVALAFSGGQPARTPGRPSKVASAAAIVVVVLAVHNARTFISLLDTRYRRFAQTRLFVDTFEHELARLRQQLPPKALTIQNELMPLPMLGLSFKYNSVAHMLKAMGEDLVVRKQGRYLIEDDGRIVEKPPDYDPMRRQKAFERQRQADVKRAKRWRQTTSPPR